MLTPPAKIGIIGGGQLGRMLTLEAKRMGYHVTVLDPKEASPAAQVADEHILADYSDREQIRRLAETTEVMTYEFEHINADALCELEDADYRIIPSGRVLRKIQNKYLQKTILKNAGLPVPDFWKVDSVQQLEQIIEDRGLPLVLKSCFGGYDGKGNIVIRERAEVEQAVKSLEGTQYYVEEYVHFIKELSIMVSVDAKGEFIHYPIAENVHEDSILRLTKVPADVDDVIQAQVVKIAKEMMDTFGDTGVFCMELFLDGSNRLYINEIAPRPHNSGHYTIEACATSQYEQLIRILTGMPLGSAELILPCAMANILGDCNPAESSYHVEGLDKALAFEKLYIHLYGKHKISRLRKLGHVTVLSECAGSAERIVNEAMSHISVIREEGTLMAEKENEPPVKVGIIMGSDSDFPVMRTVALTLKELEIGYETRVVSAHRTPEVMFEYAKSAEERGIEVIVAGAGGAAHLPGMVASLTPLPVIGVPVKSRSLDGLDSLLSIAQMPAGVPVATVGINESADAGLLAARMLGVADEAVSQRLEDM